MLYLLCVVLLGYGNNNPANNYGDIYVTMYVTMTILNQYIMAMAGKQCVCDVCIIINDNIDVCNDMCNVVMAMIVCVCVANDSNE